MNFIKLFLAAIFLFLTFSAIADIDSTLLLANQGDASAQSQLGEIYYMHIRTHHEHLFLSIVNTDSYRT